MYLCVFASQWDVCVHECECVRVESGWGNGGRGATFIGGSLNIFRLWSESQHASAQCHKGVFDGKEREKKKKRVVLGQSIGYPFKPEHSTGRFSKCQSHFWLWTDSLMDHSTASV